MLGLIVKLCENISWNKAAGLKSVCSMRGRMGGLPSGVYCSVILPGGRG